MMRASYPDVLEVFWRQMRSATIPLFMHGQSVAILNGLSISSPLLSLGALLGRATLLATLRFAPWACDSEANGVEPNTISYNILMDACVKASPTGALQKVGRVL
eukprot:792971-Amphidinium_carterae.2